MVQKFTVSRFHHRAGLFFFTIIVSFILFFTDFGGCCECALSRVCAEEDPVIVVIDPGHGGGNLGGEYEDYTEKEMTLVVAKAMKEELEKYEGVTVYLTRSDDAGMTLEERCEYAKSVNADFLFCLHFNLSENHTLFGAETWVSAFGEAYSRGYAFASIEIELLEEMGLYSRGIKTRLNDDGEDYYGIIRHATERDLPCVLIEHCHLDQENDKPFYDHKEKLEAFGRLDAEAVARYYGLRSESLGKDFSDYQTVSMPIPTQTMKPDSTEPDICLIELVDQDMETGDVRISVSASDYDSGMLYYTYSYDGGVTFSELQRWPDKTKDTFAFTMNVPAGIIPQVIVNAYNGYDLYTASNTLNLPSMDYGMREEAPEKSGEGEMPQDPADSVETVSVQVLQHRPEETEKKDEITFTYFLQVCIVCAVLIFAMVFSMLLILRGYGRRHRRRSRKRK